ncbi:ribosome 60S biogenesis N-terminal-domain-containing protein [Xylariales sp. AK1849]|nr:ribosome 60S biogenesis N-terminal-domain-containing protein [Xylariales sp. AK1849]
MKRKRNTGPEASNPKETDTTRPPKRKRNVIHEAPTSEEVHTARQLIGLLAFEQDLRKSRHGLQSFKDLLDGTLKQDGKEDESKLPIVTQYLDMTHPRDAEDEVPVYLPDIMDAWSMASQMGNENVMSAVAVVLALLLKFLSSHVHLVPTGLGIARTILQKRQQELLAKNLSADKGKDFIISPTLRLLREIICLDGGALATPTFRARNYTFKSLARNMGLRFLGDGIEDPKRPSVRTNAVRVLLSSLKFLHVEAKRDLLSQKDVVAALMRGLRDDPPYLVFEILNVLKTSVIVDQKLSKDVKIRLLNSQSLGRIASLYTYQHEQSTGEDTRSVEDAAHEFLLAACTTASAGILRAQSGFYPDGVNPDIVFGSGFDKSDDVGLESIPWMDEFEEDVPVRNTLLSDFIQTLKPWSSLKQNELLVAIFAACPELVANYFANKKSFSFDPKLSATWIGYSSLLFKTIQLDVPQFFGHHKKYARLPPPTAVVLGNILPLPLGVKAISRSLTQKSKLISFFAIRLLVIALEKLSTILGLHQKASSASDTLWTDASRRLIDEFGKRMPSIKEIINAYRAVPENDLLQRVAASRLLVLYHEVVPQVALVLNFDFSPLLSAALKRFEASTESGEEASMRLMELENLFAIAKYSPGMKWFARGKENTASPFITLLKLNTENAHGLTTAKSTRILHFVAKEHELVTRHSEGSGLGPLVAALRSCETVGSEVWTFLDNCSERCARSPIKYQEMVLELLAENEGNAKEEPLDESLPPLMMTMVEQLPFAVSSLPDKGLKTIAVFLSRYLGYSCSVGIRGQLLEVVLHKFVSNFGKSKIRKHLSIPGKIVPLEETEVHMSPVQKATEVPHDETSRVTQEQLEQTLAVPIKISKDNSALVKWTSKSAEELVEEGYATSVIWLLSSEHLSVRKESVTSVLKIAAKIKESTYEENEQVWLLLSELAETVKRNDESTIPSTIIAFVCRALDVLKNPTHCVYPKLNRFLTRGPVWDLHKIPLVQNILQEGPTEDDAYYTELSWLLSYLLDGLRTTEDVALFHKRKDFERIFALNCNPYMGINLRIQILRILYRVTTIDGGSDTLISRFGAVSWLESQKAMAGDDAGLYQALVTRLWETCDQKRIAVWSRDFVKTLAEST